MAHEQRVWTLGEVISVDLLNDLEARIAAINNRIFCGAIEEVGAPSGPESDLPDGWSWAINGDIWEITHNLGREDVVFHFEALGTVSSNVTYSFARHYTTDINTYRFRINTITHSTGTSGTHTVAGATTGSWLFTATVPDRVMTLP